MNDVFTIFLDLDGVIVGFDSGYAQISKGMNFDEYAAKYGEASATRYFLARGYNFWSDLPWERGGKELYGAVKKLFKHINILSSSGCDNNVGKHEEVVKGKRLWLKKNIPELADKAIIVSNRHHKQKYASKFGILIDDLGSNIQEWNSAGGYGILHNSKHYTKTIDTLVEITTPLNLSEIVKHLK